MAACPFLHILIHLNYCNPGDRSPRLCFPGDNKSRLQALIETRGSEFPPATHTSPHVTTTRLLNASATQCKQEGVGPSAAPGGLLKPFCGAISVLPGCSQGRAASAEPPQQGHRSPKTSEPPPAGSGFQSCSASQELLTRSSTLRAPRTVGLIQRAKKGIFFYSAH